jgi:hypothetical protein
MWHCPSQSFYFKTDETNTITLVLKNSLQTEEERNLSLVGRNSVSSPEIVNMSSERPPSTTIIQSKSHSPAQTRGDHRLQWNACLSKTFSSTWRYDNTNTESSNHTEPAITNDTDEDSLCRSLTILVGNTCNTSDRPSPAAHCKETAAASA